MTGKEKGQQAEAQAVIDEGARRQSKCACVCVYVSACVYESVSTPVCVFEAVSMTRAQHLGPELKLLRSLYVIRGQ